MRRHLVSVLIFALSLGSGSPVVAKVQGEDRERVQLEVDASEAEAVLAILAKRSCGAAVEESDWQRLFSSVPYVPLKKREASLHIAFTDDEFRKFVLSPELASRAEALQRTLGAWREADLMAAARRVLAYLPSTAQIRARVYPVIKPGKNSFVFEPSTDAAIFLYLDSEETAAKFENTVAHELHHIGFASLKGKTESASAHLAPNVETAMEWMGCFAEGFAMLAAAGSPAVHPHAVSSQEERSRWDHDMANFNRDLKELEKFFLEVIDGRLEGQDRIEEKGMSFFGLQGPWYTVGYKMAVVIEEHDGRQTLIDCISDPKMLLRIFNRDASELNARNKQPMALWSRTLLTRIGT